MLDADPSSLRDWMATVGLLRLVTATTDDGCLRWVRQGGRFTLEGRSLPDDLAERCARWVQDHGPAWKLADHDNVVFGPESWREEALSASGVAGDLWCCLASDGVLHRDGKKVQASGLEYGHGGGHQHWLASMREAMTLANDPEGFRRLLSGHRAETTPRVICRWDPACERDHAYRDRAPTDDPMRQDLYINCLASVGLLSCPTAPSRNGLRHPLQRRRELAWPIWLDWLRSPDLDAALCCGWQWPTMTARRWLSGKLYCFSRGELREPEAAGPVTGGSRTALK